MANKGDLPYWAGLFDGEGCVTIIKQRLPNNWSDRYILTAVLNNTAVGLAEAMRDRFGGSVTPSNRPKYYKPHHKMQWRWQAYGSVAIRFICAVRPYLRLKNGEAKMALAFVNDRHPRPGRRRTDEETALLEGYYLALRQAKKAPIYCTD